MSTMSLEEANREAIRRIHQAKETGQWWLDLGDLPITRVPDEIAKLAGQLTVLALGRYTLKAEGEKLNWDWQRDRPGSIADLEPLEVLTSLENLDLSGCPHVADLGPLRRRNALKNLNLYSCKQVSDLDPLRELIALQYLNLSGCWHVGNLEPLRSLTALRVLNLRRCTHISSLEPLRSLTALRDLNLYSCKKVSDLDPLRNLIALQDLDLSGCSHVSNLGPLRSLTALQNLDLSGCKQLSDLKPLRSLTALQNLYLRSCSHVSDLEPLRGLIALQNLDLCHCRAEAFEPIRDRLATLNELKVFGGKFSDLHPSVCGRSGDDNAIDSARAYFAALRPDDRPDAEIKVFVLGNVRCGKTKLVGRLAGQKFEDIPEGSTHGIKVESWPAPSDWNLPHPVRLNIWDFGGQDIYYGTYALFVREPAIYLLLYADATENEKEISDGGFVHHNRLLPYWFDDLRQEAGKNGVVNSPVMFIQTQCDLSGEADHPPHVPEKQSFPQLSPLIHVSAKEEDGLDHFLPRLKKAIKELLKEHPQPPLPASWAKVRDAIRDMQQAKLPRTLTLAELAQLCETHGCPGDEEVLRDALHLMGVVFYRQGVFDDRLIVDQSWALDAIYPLFTRSEEFQDEIDSKHGRFTRKQLERYFWKEKGHSVADQRTFLSFMEECGICFKADQRLEARHEEEYEGEYIIPDKLDPWGTDHDEWFERHLRDDSGVEVVVEYGLVHDRIKRTFLSRIGSVAGDRARYWKFGCYFRDKNTQSEVLIRTEGNAIRLRAWKGETGQLLQTLVKVLQKIPSGQPPKIEWKQQANRPIFRENHESNKDDREPEKRLQPEYLPQSTCTFPNPLPRKEAAMQSIVKQEVQGAFVRAFNVNELAQMLLFRLGWDLFTVVPNGAFNDIVFELLKYAEREGSGPQLIEAAYQYRPKKTELRDLYQKYALAPTVRVGETTTDLNGLERIIRKGIPMLDMGLFWERASKIESRVCCVEIGGRPVGTGFLVGPEAVLTNYHVMANVINKQVAAGDVGLRFGYKRAAGDSILSGTVFKLARDWLVDSSPFTEGEQQDQPDAVLPRPDQLDYTLLRVEGEPGNQKIDRQTGTDVPLRGWISIPTEAEAVPAGKPLLIVQHPQGEPLKLGMDLDSTLGENANGTRLRYRTNTERGSSGSPCFDCDWKLVALHHYGDPAYHKNPEFNQGIPVGAIRRLLENRGKADVLGG